MLTRYTMTKQGDYKVEWLNTLEVQAYKVAGWTLHVYR